MATGTVKWFNATKGYGFIEDSSGGPDVFVHITQVQAAGAETLFEGQRVEYTAERGQRGVAVVELIPLEEFDSTDDRLEGTVTEWRGTFGFITPDYPGTKEVFFGIAETKRCGLPDPWKGQRVSFVERMNPRNSKTEACDIKEI